MLTHQLPRLQFRGRLGDAVVGLLLAHPTEEFGDALLERDARLVAEQRACARDVGDAVADVALAVLADELGFQLAPQPLGQKTRHLADRSGAARADVDRLVVCAVGL